MKIAVIVRRLNVRGGTQRQALELAKKWKDGGDEVVFYSFAYERNSCYEDLDSFKVVSLPPSAPSFLSRFGFFYFFREMALAKKLALLIDKDTKVLNPHAEASYKVAYYYRKLVKKIPSVWMMNDMPTKLASFERAKMVNPSLKLPFLRKIFYRLSDYFEKITFIKAQNEIIVLDNRDKGWVSEYLGRRAKVLRSGIDFSSFRYKERTQIKGKKINLLTTGIFFEHRRFEDIVLAVSMLRREGYDASLTIIGDTETDRNYADKIHSLSESLGIKEKIDILGKVEEEKLRFAYVEADIFVFASHMQSWGIAVFEAMASGLPVIVSSTAGASEVLSDGQNALIVSPKSPEAIFKAVKSLANNLDFFSLLSRNGKDFVDKNISWARFAREFRLEMENLLKKTLVITSFHRLISRNILATDLLGILKRRPDLRIVIAVPEYKTAFFEERFGGENISVFGAKQYRSSRYVFGLLFKRLDMLMFDTETARMKKRYKFSWDGKRAYYLMARFLGFLGHSFILRRIVRFLDLHLSPKNLFKELFDLYGPDLVFLTDLQNENDISVGQDAIRRGIPVIGMFRSWDNPTQRLLRIWPEKLLVGSKEMFEETISNYKYPKERVKIVGSPHYDKYLKKPARTREQFFAHFGLDPKKKLILFCPGGSLIIKKNDYDQHILETLAKYPTQILVRFPLGGDVPLVNYKKPDHVFFDMPGEKFGEKELELRLEDDLTLIEEITYSDVVVSGPTSICLDSTFLDKPIIAAEMYSSKREWREENWGFYTSHIKKLFACDGVKRVRNKDELFSAISGYIKNPKLQSEGRALIRKKWFSSIDGYSSEKIVHELLECL